MRIVLDATPIGVQTSDKGGVYRYISQLIAAIDEIGPSHQFTLLINYCHPRHNTAFEEARRSFDSSRFEVVRGRIPKALWMGGWIPAELVAGPLDVFHGLYDFVPPVVRGASVLTIHDLRYVSMDGSADSEVIRYIKDEPQLLAEYQHRLSFFRQQCTIIRKVARRARLIVTPSEFSKRSIVDILDVPAERVRVIHHGVSDELRRPVPRELLPGILQRFSISEPYLLFVGKLDPLKNLDMLLRAYSIVRRKKGIRLVLAGPSGWYGAVLRQRAEELGIASNVTFTGHITDEELKALYQGASLMIFPSLFEGFGLPVIEAMASGTPVVCSNDWSLPEVADKAALLVDPTSDEAIAEAVLKVLEDKDLYNSLRSAGLRRSEQFTWLEAARKTVLAYECAAST